MRRACYLNPGRDLATAVNLARRVEALGYDSAWVTHGLGRDSFVVLAAYGAATSRLGLGNGVVPVYPRHPVAMAQAALTLSEATGGRFRLGIGVSHRASMETQLGLTLTEPLAITDNRAPALAAFQNELTRYLMLPFYRAMLEAAGLGEHIKAFDRDGTTTVALADALGSVGPPAAARTYMDAYRRAGATLPAVRPITFPDAPWYTSTLEEAAKF